MPRRATLALWTAVVTASMHAAVACGSSGRPSSESGPPDDGSAPGDGMAENEVSSPDSGTDANVGATIEAAGDVTSDATTDAAGLVVDGGVDAAAPTLAEACSAWALAWCSRSKACNPVTFGYVYGTVDTCAQGYATLYCPARQQAPGVTETTRLLMTCAQDTAAQSCLVSNLMVPASCLAPGTLADDAGCEFNLQCQSTFCNHPSGGACGTCAARKNVGDVCDPAQFSCPRGFYCANSTCGSGLPPEGGTCQATNLGTCIAIPDAAVPTYGLGHACDSFAGIWCDPYQDLECIGGTCAATSYADAGQPCTFGPPVFCAAGGTCTGDAGGTGTCTGAAGNGQPCDPAHGIGCITPASCVGGVCEPPPPATSCQ